MTISRHRSRIAFLSLLCLVLVLICTVETHPHSVSASVRHSDTTQPRVEALGAHKQAHRLICRTRVHRQPFCGFRYVSTAGPSPKTYFRFFYLFHFLFFFYFELRALQRSQGDLAGCLAFTGRAPQFRAKSNEKKRARRSSTTPAR